MNRLHHDLFCSAWAITPTAWLNLAQASKQTTEPKADWLDFLDDFVVQRRKPYVDNNKVGHLFIEGPLYMRIAKLDKKLGLCDMLDIQAEIKELVAQGAKGLLVEIDSPGGSVIGTHETAQALINSGLPYVVFTDHLNASAAYYISAGAAAIVSTRSALVGSIGVYIPWVDYQGWYEDMGLEWNPVVSKGADLKTTGGGPTLTEAQREYLQSSVNMDADQFHAWIANYRELPQDILRGQVASGQQAIDYNLIDAIGDRETAYSLVVDAME